MAGRKVKADLGAAAGSEHIRRSAAERVDQGRGIVGLNVEFHVLGCAIEIAAGVAARIVGHDRVAVGETPRDIGEDTGVLRAAGDDQQDGARPLHLVVDAGAGHLQRGRFHRMGHGNISCRLNGRECGARMRDGPASRRFSPRDLFGRAEGAKQETMGCAAKIRILAAQTRYPRPRQTIAARNVSTSRPRGWRASPHPCGRLSRARR